MNVHYLYEIESDVIKTYYQMKNKNQNFFNAEEKELFVQKIVNKVNKIYNLGHYDCILIPETENQCFKEIVARLKIKTVILQKNSKKQVLERLALQSMMKDERKKLVSCIESMQEIKIGLIASNQRVRVSNILFHINEDLKDKRILFMDDSVFTGSTLKAIRLLVNFKEAFVLFSNQD